MALTRERILDSAQSLLSTYGLGDLSMRRLAGELGVAPGALYYHVRNKQELLSLLATRLLVPVGSPQDPSPGPLSVREAREEVLALALGTLETLLPVTDAADVVAVALAVDPASVPQHGRLADLLAGAGLSPRHAAWGATTVLCTVLGLAQHAQNRAQLPGASPAASADPEAARHGLAALVSGLLPAPSPTDAPGDRAGEAGVRPGEGSGPRPRESPLA